MKGHQRSEKAIEIGKRIAEARKEAGIPRRSSVSSSG